MSNGAADAPQFSTIARPGFLTFGQDPNDLTNATGRLPNDRPHIFRATGVVRLPWKGFLVAANLQHFSGKPWAATAQVTLRARAAGGSCSSRAGRAGCRRSRCSICGLRRRSRWARREG